MIVMKIFHFPFLYIIKQVPVPIVTTMWSPLLIEKICTNYYKPMQILIHLTQIFPLTYPKQEKLIQTLKMKTGTYQTDFKSSQLKQKEKLKSDRD